MMEGIGDAIKLGTKIVGVLERLTTDTNIKDEFRAKGLIKGMFSLGDYAVEFVVRDKKRSAIPAEVEKVEAAETTGEEA